MCNFFATQERLRLCHINPPSSDIAQGYATLRFAPGRLGALRALLDVSLSQPPPEVGKVSNVLIRSTSF